jgi:hypothetical protein
VDAEQNPTQTPNKDLTIVIDEEDKRLKEKKGLKKNNLINDTNRGSSSEISSQQRFLNKNSSFQSKVHPEP